MPVYAFVYSCIVRACVDTIMLNSMFGTRVSGLSVFFSASKKYNLLQILKQYASPGFSFFSFKKT